VPGLVGEEKVPTARDFLCSALSAAVLSALADLRFFKAAIQEPNLKSLRAQRTAAEDAELAAAGNFSGGCVV